MKENPNIKVETKAFFSFHNLSNNLAHTHCSSSFLILGSSNVGDTLPTGQLSNIPWRRAGVKYTNNEAYFDVVEEIDAIIDKSGNYVHVVFWGKLQSIQVEWKTEINPLAGVFQQRNIHFL